MPAGSYLATARTDGRDWLVEADEPLAGLQLRSGGELPGIVATPALLELVRKARRYGLKLARPIHAQDDRERVTAWVEIEPDAGGEGCRIGVANWQSAPLAHDDPATDEERRAAIERHVAELSARLGSGHEVLSVECDSEELAQLAGKLHDGIGRRWTELIDVEGAGEHRQPLHWRLLDGARVAVPGSPRHWRVVLLPLGQPEPGQAGFDLLLVLSGVHVAAVLLHVVVRRDDMLSAMFSGRKAVAFAEAGGAGSTARAALLFALSAAVVAALVLLGG